MYLIYLDDYHLDDLLYLPGLAQRMGRMQRARPACLFVHGSGGEAERLLEAEGLFPESQGGLVQAQTPQEAALVERALRQVNRRIVAALTEEGVHAVGFQGSDRGLLRSGEGGVVAGRVAWLKTLVDQRAVPVVSALVQDPEAGTTRVVPPAAATVMLARALDAGDLVVVFFTRNNKPGIIEDNRTLPALSLDTLPQDSLPDPGAVGAVVRAGFPVLLTSAHGLFGGEEVQGTRILA